MPQGPIGVQLPSLSGKHYAANNAGDIVKTGAGLLGGLIVNKAGTTSTAALYDGTDNTGTLLGTVDTSALRQVNFGIKLLVGLFVVLAGGAAADVTITYR